MGVNLTRHERETRWAAVYEMRSVGLTHQQIADRLGVSRHTASLLCRQAKWWNAHPAVAGTIAELSTRAHNCARSLGASEYAIREEMADVLRRAEAGNPRGLMGVRNLGRKSLAEIRNWMAGR